MHRPQNQEQDEYESDFSAEEPLYEAIPGDRMLIGAGSLMVLSCLGASLYSMGMLFTLKTATPFVLILVGMALLLKWMDRNNV